MICYIYISTAELLMSNCVVRKTNKKTTFFSESHSGQNTLPWTSSHETKHVLLLNFHMSSTKINSFMKDFYRGLETWFSVSFVILAKPDKIAWISFTCDMNNKHILVTAK